MNLIIHLIVSALAIIVSAYLLPSVTVTLTGAIILAIVLGLINISIKPIVKMIALPITIVTLGLFSLVINALFVLLADKIVPGFDTGGFWSAFWFAIVLALVNAAFHFFQSDEKIG